MLILFLYILVATQDATFSLLSQTREKITFVPYTAEQRQLVANNVEKLMSMYVNRQSKIQNYGALKPDIDPIPRVQAIKSKVANMTDKEMHLAYSEVFRSLRDFQYILLT